MLIILTSNEGYTVTQQKKMKTMVNYLRKFDFHLFFDNNNIFSRNYFTQKSRYSPTSWTYFEGSPTHLTSLSTNNLSENVNMQLNKLFPKTGKLSLSMSISLIRDFHRMMVDDLNYVMQYKRLNKSKRQTIVAAMLRMEVMSNLGETMAQCEMRNKDPYK